MTPGPGRLLTRPALILLVAFSGVLLAGQSGLISARYGPVTLYLLIGLIAVALAALARPRGR